MPSYPDALAERLPFTRPEAKVFAELEVLCKSSGFIHAVAKLCLRNNGISFNEQLTYENFSQKFSDNSLVRTEISLLISLMLKGGKWDEDIHIEEINLLCSKAEELLKDLHVSILEETERQTEDGLCKGRQWLKEAIFYSGESAYGSQYLDLSQKRYTNDQQWFIENKGFTIEQAANVSKSIFNLLNTRVGSSFSDTIDVENYTHSLLPFYSFSLTDIVNESGENSEIVEAFLAVFTIDETLITTSYTFATDFNPIEAQPILRSNGQYIVLEIASLYAALYEAPFYWLIKDKSYYSHFVANRGAFTEEFSAERLERVFGKNRVYRNVIVEKSKKKTVDEIDVLVIYGDLAIVLQAKSKRLTLKAKQGNEDALTKDFSQAVQAAYNQAFSCAESLISNQYRLIKDTGEELILKKKLKHIYPVCVISDHYPSLNSQVDHYLITKSRDAVQPPYVMDVFFLDVISEFLTSPLHFLNYINLRVNNRRSVVSQEELAVFAMHLTAGLRHVKSDNAPLLLLGGHTAIPVGIALLARREGYPGKETPEGLLTEKLDSPIQKLIKSIDVHSVPEGIQFGLFLLQLYPKDQASFNRYFSEILRRAKVDGQPHDFTIMPHDEYGMTIHINSDTYDDAYRRLLIHCENRKYKERKNRWLGLCICPQTEEIRFGIDQDYLWESSLELDERTYHMHNPKPLTHFETYIRPQKKIGRNDKCFCGSGKKYKRCCY
ncbi:SEC-C metal-binding domain-containing protein [Neptuniibacter sp. QD37_6]|uniref:SEC-C metal-binding domain-containing protein n=1 Tax=Neptuniibacter sp. QD37_6 TaxID=3398210 RepID=UPI0039F5E290